LAICKNALRGSLLLARRFGGCAGFCFLGGEPLGLGLVAGFLGEPECAQFRGLGGDRRALLFDFLRDGVVALFGRSELALRFPPCGVSVWIAHGPFLFAENPSTPHSVQANYPRKAGLRRVFDLRY
jgi:hypothetical protein